MVLEKMYVVSKFFLTLLLGILEFYAISLATCIIFYAPFVMFREGVGILFFAISTLFLVSYLFYVLIENYRGSVSNAERREFRFKFFAIVFALFVLYNVVTLILLGIYG